MKQKINSRIENSLWKQLQEYARLNGLKICFIIEIAILEYLNRKNEEAKK